MKKILLVEDTPDLLKNLSDVLRMEGFEVIPAVDGIDGLEQLNHHTPDLIITDVLMPRMNGYMFIETLKASETYRDIPVLIFSAKATQENEMEGLKLGAVQYLKKPCPTDFLLRIIRNLINETE